MFNATDCLPKSKHDFIVTQVSIIIHRQNGFCFNHVVRQEPVVQTVSC